jgi:hypothetical protein
MADLDLRGKTNLYPRIAMRPVYSYYSDRGGLSVYRSNHATLARRIPTGIPGTIDGTMQVDRLHGALLVAHDESLDGVLTIRALTPAPLISQRMLHITYTPPDGTPDTIVPTIQVTRERIIFRRTMGGASLGFAEWGTNSSDTLAAGLANSPYFTTELITSIEAGEENPLTPRLMPERLIGSGVDVWNDEVPDGHVEDGCLECLTTAELGGNIVVWNTSGSFVAARSTSQDIAESQIRNPAIKPGRGSAADRAEGCGASPDCAGGYINYPLNACDNGVDLCLFCMASGQTNVIPRPCTMEYLMQPGIAGNDIHGNNVPFCVGPILTYGGRGAVPDKGTCVQREDPGGPGSRTIDLDGRPFCTQSGRDALFTSRLEGGWTNYFVADADLAICPCEDGGYCGGTTLVEVWLCRWLVTNSHAGFGAMQTLCNRPWGLPDAGKPPEDPRPFRLELNQFRQIMFVDADLTRGDCFPLPSHPFCFHAPAAINTPPRNMLTWYYQLWSSGRDHPMRFLDAVWNMSLSDSTGNGGRYPHESWAVWMRGRVLESINARYGSLGSAAAWSHVTGSAWDWTGLNLWVEVRDGLDWPVEDESGEEIPITLTGWLTGDTYAARLIVTRVVVRAFLNVEMRAQKCRFSDRIDNVRDYFRYTATIDVWATTRVRREAAADAEHRLKFLTGDRYDLRLADPDDPTAEHPTERLLIHGPHYERVPQARGDVDITVRWRGVRAVSPYGFVATGGGGFARTCPDGLVHNDALNCCRPLQVIHGTPIHGERNDHRPSVFDPDDPDPGIIQFQRPQLCRGQIIFYIPGLEGWPGAPDIRCNCQ